VQRPDRIEANEPAGDIQVKITNYKLAGWLAIVSVVMNVPLFLMNLYLDTTSDYIPGVNAMLVFLSCLTTVIGIFLWFVFRHLLHERFDFHDADRLISVMIAANILLCGLIVMRDGIPGARHILQVPILLLLIPVGVVLILFAVKLLSLPDDPAMLLKPYAYLNAVSGFCLITVLLTFLGLLIGMVTGIILAFIFFRAAEQVEFV
jgi:hypothetical protein